jgi:hypothetical protein
VAESMQVEPTESRDCGPCECCGTQTRRVWGFVHSSAGTAAAYFVQWAVGRVADHGALFDLILGRWGDGTTARDRVLVALDYRLTDCGPAFMVIESVGRPAAESDQIGRALARTEVVGQPIAEAAFTVADAVLAQDARVKKLLGSYNTELACQKRAAKRNTNGPFPAPVRCVSFAPDGYHLPLGNGAGTVYILRLAKAATK